MSWGKVTLSLVAVLSAGTVLLPAADPGGLDAFAPNVNGRVRAIVVQPDKRVLIGGDFTTVNSTNRNRVARLHPDGSLDLSFNPGSGASGEVLCLALQADGKILVGGGFAGFGGPGHSYLARLKADGSLDTVFDPKPDNWVRDIAIQTDGRSVVAGAFTQLGNLSRNCLGRLDANGAIDPSFAPNPDAQVNTVLLQPDGRIAVGGFFTRLAGATQKDHLGRIYDDGSLDSSFDITADGPVWRLVMDSSDRIVVGGNFSELGGQSRTNIGRVYVGGFLDFGFEPNADSTVNSLAVQIDGRIIIGGNFNLLGGQTNKFIGRLDTDGSADSTFPNVAANGTLYSLALQADGKILVGGSFTTLGGVSRNAIGRFGQALVSPDNDNFVNRVALLMTSSKLAVNGNNLAATGELGETNFLGTAFGGRSVWYAHTPPAQGLLRILLDPECCDDTISYSMLLARGSSVSNLSGLVAPILVDNGNLIRRARAIYADLKAGQEYVIAVDGGYENGNILGGNFSLDLLFVPSPSNDNFEQRSNIVGNGFSAAAPFFAASREQANEPSHGGGNGSLWWNWSAPVSGLATLRATQPGNFVPYLAVYQGNQLANLSPVSSTSEIIGHTRQLRFPVVQGQTFALAVCGEKFDNNTFPHIHDDVYGNGSFEFAFTTVALRLANLLMTTNETNGVDFSVAAGVENFGSVRAGPLRLRLVARPGLSEPEQGGQAPPGYEVDNIPLGTFQFSASGQAAPGLNNPVTIGGTCPAPSRDAFGSEGAFGWEVFCLLEEEHGANWLLCDKLLVLQGVWPNVAGYGGPGGGVIRLDPALGTDKSDDLVSVQILGPSPIYEGTRTQYHGLATFVTASAYDFTNTLWQTTRFAITNGVLQTGAINADTDATIGIQYSFRGLAYNASRTISVLNLPAPSLVVSPSNPRLPLVLTLSGVGERKHVIEVCTNLAPPILWTPIATNVSSASGLWSFTDPAKTDFRLRIYRARETE